ncbi:MAG: 30S ribosomal protein S18 [Deltaproteobacteria bacterium]|nr:30S ribosomal protein S18 [Deltaproteobacteria bacterium]
MAAPRDQKRPQRKKTFIRKRICRFCADKTLTIDYKDVKILTSFIGDQGKIVPSRIFGNCAKHQRKCCEAIKRARQIALLPYSGTSRVVR